MQVSGGSRCSEECPCASGSTSNLLISFCASTNRHQHLFAGLFGCNRLRAPCCLSLLIYIYIRYSLCRCPTRVFVSKGRVPVNLRSHVAGPFPSPFCLALWYKTPEVPPHSTHPCGIPRQRIPQCRYESMRVEADLGYHLKPARLELEGAC